QWCSRMRCRLVGRSQIDRYSKVLERHLKPFLEYRKSESSFSKLKSSFSTTKRRKNFGKLGFEQKHTKRQ
ncbi:MAG: hypothetical protein U0L37_06465, partial [Bacteroidales bacterium]|nr:hypothetical protein [Bacteroidales bacterium]